ncbi:hypothetical protein HNY73_015943 [Argiope bruennichi]|uniref:Granulin n=1 Tax=Argiope bruennichi TaxID=94029 RepID=A0A8T0EHJ9_ARGBR|nr:hypothetical protein HNY73_015943 [Argiope bruennichi]
MKILLFVLLLPCVFGANTKCSDNTVCPEGYKCCTTYDDKIRCCDIKNSNSKFVKTTRPLQVVPSVPLQPYVNATQPVARYGSCYKDINCFGTCCDDNCCPYELATCCDHGCCSYYSTCCEGYTKYLVTKRWCLASQGIECEPDDDHKCLSKDTKRRLSMNLAI